MGGKLLARENAGGFSFVALTAVRRALSEGVTRVSAAPDPDANPTASDPWSVGEPDDMRGRLAKEAGTVPVGVEEEGLLAIGFSTPPRCALDGPPGP